MGVFIRGWASSRSVAHAVSQLVQPSTTIVSASAAAASVITTSTPHYYVTGDTVLLAGVTGSTPAVDGSRVVTVLTPTTFSIPLTVTVAGTGGTATRTTPVEPLTLAEGKLRAGLDWTTGDARDALMSGFISAARAKVEQDTGLALLTQVRDVYYDAIGGAVLALPSQSKPLQAVVSVSSVDTDGVTNVLATDQYLVDTASGRIGLSDAGAWPTDLRTFQPYVVRIVAGYASIAAIPPLLIHAVGLLTAHFATLGRDLASVDQASLVPMGYEDAIAAYVPVTVV